MCNANFNMRCVVVMSLFSAQSLRSLRLCGELFAARIHRRDAEHAEFTQRVNPFETAFRASLCLIGK
jgi:hypothetical protein